MRDMVISDVLKKEMVFLDMEPFKDKENMFSFLADEFVKNGIVDDASAYIYALEERENLGSTYMGNLIALPHGKCQEVRKQGIAFCRLKEVFHYRSHGEEGDVRYVFMLAIAGSESGDAYLRMLATLAGLLAHEDFMEVLANATCYEDIIEAVAFQEERR